ncbi:MAG: nuclear transport factor 2 family protein [Burkholderiaceae bacterium]
MSDHLSKAKSLFENLSRDKVSLLRELYAQDAWFKDPFNEVTGIEAICKIFDHMFDQVQNPRFVVKDAVAQGPDAFLTWDFLFDNVRMGGAQTVRGASHLKFDTAGKITYHRDYWDVAEELYEKIPLLGAFMRFVKRRANA